MLDDDGSGEIDFNELVDKLKGRPSKYDSAARQARQGQKKKKKARPEPLWKTAARESVLGKTSLRQKTEPPLSPSKVCPKGLAGTPADPAARARAVTALTRDGWRGAALRDTGHSTPLAPFLHRDAGVSFEAFVSWGVYMLAIARFGKNPDELDRVKRMFRSSYMAADEEAAVTRRVVDAHLLRRGGPRAAPDRLVDVLHCAGVPARVRPCLWTPVHERRR